MGVYQSKDLFEAIESHDRRKLKRILKQSKTRFQYILDRHGCPAICQVAKYGHDDFIPLLIKYGFDIHIPDDRCWFAVHYAASAGNCDAIYILVSRGKADVTRRCPVDTCRCAKQTALHVAALYGHYKAVESLLQCGCDVMALDHKGKTAAQVAEEKGFREVADLLHRTEKLRS